LLDKSLEPKPEVTEKPDVPSGKSEGAPPSTVEEPGGGEKGVKGIEDTPIKKFSSITVSGKVPLERYTELFGCFITPFTMSGYKLEIEMKFKIKPTETSPLDETKPQYKSAKEAAKQLGLNFEEE